MQGGYMVSCLAAGAGYLEVSADDRGGDDGGGDGGGASGTGGSNGDATRKKRKRPRGKQRIQRTRQRHNKALATAAPEESDSKG